MINPLISIIVPVYNSEKFLSECINSIICQTFTSWELLLIDDGSTDKSAQICDAYALKDSRIKVFHKKNAGVSSARNVGICHATGEWVSFIDADDIVHNRFLEGMYMPLLNGESVDFVHGGCFNMKGGKITSINQSYNNYVDSDPSYVISNLRGLVFSKLFRLSNIKNSSLYFDERMKIAEDMAFTIDYMLTVRKYAFVSEIGYYYRVDNMDSATRTKRILPYHMQKQSFLHLYSSINNYLQKFNLSEKQMLIRYQQLAHQLQDLIKSMYLLEWSRNDRINEISALLNSDYSKVLKYSSSGFIIKVLNILLLTHNVLIYDFIMSLIYSLRLK